MALPHARQPARRSGRTATSTSGGSASPCTGGRPGTRRSGRPTGCRRCSCTAGRSPISPTAARSGAARPRRRPGVGPGPTRVRRHAGAVGAALLLRGVRGLGGRIRHRGRDRRAGVRGRPLLRRRAWPSATPTTTRRGCSRWPCSTRSAAPRGRASGRWRSGPLWDWGIHFPGDVLPGRQIRRVLPVVLEDAVPNLLRNPRAVWRVAQLARKADLTAELEELKRRRLPVAVFWGDQDKIIPRASFEALCAALGTPGEVVPGVAFVAALRPRGVRRGDDQRRRGRPRRPGAGALGRPPRRPAHPAEPARRPPRDENSTTTPVAADPGPRHRR